MNAPLKIRFGAVFTALLVSGCSLASATPATLTPGVTEAYQTVEAQLTLAATPTRPATVTTRPLSTAETTLQTPTRTLNPTRTQPASASLTPTTAGMCDKAAPGNPIDVTIEDGAEMFPGQQFTKIWRLVNAGTCTWTREYRAVWFFGDKFGDTLSVLLNDEIPPGNSVEITVDMTAPQSTGSYRSNWKLQNAEGGYFGIGPNADAPFWVEIAVVQPAANTATQKPSPTLTPTTAITPTASLTPTQPQPVQASGEVVLPVGSAIDLDSAELNPGSGEDAGYGVDLGVLHWITPQGEALLGVYGSGEPPYAACVSAGKSAAPIAVESLSVGSYLCYQTGESRFGWMRFASLHPDDGSLTIQVLTWAIP